MVEAITNTNTSSTTANQLIDADSDTMIQVEESSDEDTIRMDVGGTEIMTLSSSGAVITTADNLDTLSLISTDADANVGPVLKLWRNTASPADDDVLGNIIFAGEDDAGNEHDFFRMDVQSPDVSNGAEDAQVRQLLSLAGSEVEYVRMNATGFIFNENSADLDFRIESNGNANMLFVDGGNDRVGIGTASPDRNLHVSTAGDTYLRVSGDRGNSNDLHIGNIEFENTNGSNGVIAEMRAITGSSGTQSTMGQLAFYTDNGSAYAERMRISSAGLMCIGDTEGRGGSADAPTRLQLTGPESVLGVKCSTITDSSQRNMILFNDNGGTLRGSITSNNSSTAYNTSSDYRLKEVLEPLPNGLDRLNQLKPIKFKWKEQGYNAEGFLAHEVAEVFPEAVSGEKDAVNKDGEIVGQQMDYGRITPLLVKAIQEQQTIIDDLKSRIETLEG